MPKPNLQAFLADRNLVALKLSSAELAGLFKKSLVVPKDCAGLALFADGAVTLFPEGKEVAGRFDLVLAKLGDIQLRQPLADLRSKDGFLVHTTLGFSVTIQTGRPDLFKDFTRAYFNFPGAYAATDLRTAVMPEAKRIVSDFVAARGATELHKRDHFKEIEGILRAGLERAFFGAGVRLEKVLEVHFTAAEFAERAAAEARRADEDQRRNEKIGRKEEQLKRLASFLNDTSFKELLAKLPDDRVRGLFYAKLMEDDSSTLTPADVAAKLNECGANVHELVYKAMEGLLPGGGSGVDPADVPPESTDSIFVALGSKVIILDPSKPQEKGREYQFKDPLRSVRTVDQGKLLVGSKRSVHAVSLADSNCVEYPLPDDRSPKGGVNSIAAWGDWIFATHSEFGVARWDARKPSVPGEILFRDITSRHKTTRGVQVAGERLLFASGDRVWSVHLGNGSMKPVERGRGLDGPVTALVSAGGAIFAGTENGSIVAWKGDEPEAALLVRRKESIVNLRLAKVCSIPHLFYSTKDLSIRARVIGQNLETSYESGGSSVGVLDAASDLVAASDAAGRRVLLWKATSPQKPAFDVDVARYSDKPILDLWMKKSKVPVN